ncbi:MAG: hypothetical protein HW404_650 [Anaerolineales bacterium]|nr:hypothetical protein [Anaerolineales bacterium]
MSPKKTTKTSGRSTSAKGKSSSVFTAEEKAAMRAAAAERKRGGKSDGESDVQAAIAAMKGSDRTMAKRIHEIVKASAPSLAPKTWYGMPAYANADGKAVCFFQAAAKFKARYASFGFNDVANLDEGAMWPVAFALTELTPAGEAKIAALVKKAVS